MKTHRHHVSTIAITIYDLFTVFGIKNLWSLVLEDLVVSDAAATYHVMPQRQTSLTK